MPLRGAWVPQNASRDYGNENRSEAAFSGMYTKASRERERAIERGGERQGELFLLCRVIERKKRKEYGFIGRSSRFVADL